jgi:hypothetical protein
MFIQFDGQKAVDQVLAATAGLGVSQADVDYLVEQGFLKSLAAEVSQTAPLPLVAEATEAEMAPGNRSSRSDQERYQDAKPLATKLTAGLGLRGFMLNLSVESAAGYDDLLVLFPKIQDAVGSKACRELEAALKG